MAKGLLHKVLRDKPFEPFTVTKIEYGKNGKSYPVTIHKKGVTPNSQTNYNSSKCHVNNVYYAEGTKTLKISGTVTSDTRPGRAYSVEVDVMDVKREDGLSEEELLSGFYPRPNINEKTIQIRCNCESYRFRFAEYNQKEKASAGYFGKLGVSKSGRAPNNPKGWPGECKHIREFVNYLIQQGFVIDK